MQVACNRTQWSGVVAKLQTDCFVNSKVGGSNPLLGNTSTLDVFFITLQLHGILQYFLLPRDGSHLSAVPKTSECQSFYFLTFSAER